jgi:hypothetical protein
MATQQNQYDVRRQAIRDEETKRRKAEQEAMQRRLASRGFTAGTGYAESQQRKAEEEAMAGERGRLQGVDIEQLAAGERSTEAARAREWQTGERVGAQSAASEEARAARGWQTGESEAAAARAANEARLGREWQTGEAGAARGWQSEEAGRGREFTAQQAEKEREIAWAGLEQRQQEIDNAATEFVSKLDFDYWATESGFSEAERERAWQERQNTIARNAASVETALDREWRTEMLGYEDILLRGRMELSDVLETQQAALKNRTDYLYQLGQSNTPVDTSDLSSIEKDAYEMGKTGRAYEDYQKYIIDQTTLRNQLVLTLAEAPELKDDITSIWKEFESLINPGELYGQVGG